MTTNQRDTFRIYRTFDDAELFHEGRVVACTVHNLSAGGAQVESALEMPEGSHCTLGLRLDPQMAADAGIEYLSFHMSVLEATPRAGGQLTYRLRNETRPGSPEYEAAAKLVFAAQRRELAERSGADEASPMAHDTAKPRRRRSIFKVRFGKGSTR
ncbi:MAG: hypothetical protein JWM25_821 [Thermoleophilia bacterium]|nr:hypothetical protein [Thermoleophilia bacterium]MCZ4496238.1 hypothetical protein [Thermoleophilia bacterium]